MCRFLGYLGPPTTLEELLIAPEQGLLKQSWDPKHQLRGTINADGFGVGWYEPPLRSEPALYRSTKPMWADRSFASMAGIVRSGAVLAAVRSATPPAITEEANVPPFVSGTVLFAHNGAVERFRDGVSSKLRRTLSERRDSQITGTTDSEVLFALLLDLLDAGATMTDALIGVVREVLTHTSATLNMIVTDGDKLAAVASGDSLFVLPRSGAGTFVTSEPFDDDPGWDRVDDGHVVEATSGNLSVKPIASPEGDTAR